MAIKVRRNYVILVGLAVLLIGATLLFWRLGILAEVVIGVCVTVFFALCVVTIPLGLFDIRKTGPVIPLKKD